MIYILQTQIEGEIVIVVEVLDTQQEIIEIGESQDQKEDWNIRTI